LLIQLKIKNFALIDHLEVEFSNGMTCITGETGAGKSILLGGLSLVLGKRADLSSFFDSSRKCIVEATFDIKNYTLEALFNTFDLDYEEETVLRRELLPHGKSRAFINDTPVNLSVLEKVSLNLIDIHSQNDTLSLLENEYQFQVLDAIANNQEILTQYQKTLALYKSTLKEHNHYKEVHTESKDALELKQFLFEELQNSKLQVGMQEDIEIKLSTLSHVEYLQTTLASSIQLLEQESLGILDQMKELRRHSQGLSDKSKEYKEIHERIIISSIETEDFLELLKQKFDHLEANPKKLQELNSQMDFLNSLYQKHKVNNIDDLLAIKKKLELTLNDTLSLDHKLSALEQMINEQSAILTILSQKLTKQRKNAIHLLKIELEQILTKMGMKDTLFKIELINTDKFLLNGMDQLSFQFSANKGGDFKSLKKVASGGELSRIMLAIKTVLSRYKKLPTLVFDEIDSGVSGKISGNIAEVMANMSKKLQVFTITHLPQVAAKGDHHFKVEKSEQNGKFKTQLHLLNPETRINEIAKMLSKNEITDTAIAHARELMN
jgi:DNA repair protein RecN (Recombination protein N)